MNLLRRKAARRQLELMIAITQHRAARKGNRIPGNEILERNTPLTSLQHEINELDRVYGRVEGRFVRVAGVSYRQEDIKWLVNNPHTELDLIPDPHNEHDPNAVKVMACTHHLGFIPKNVTPQVHLLLNTHALVDVSLVNIHPVDESKPESSILGVRIVLIYTYLPELSEELDRLRDENPRG